MLQFPAWKVALIVIVLLWGGLSALPNIFSDRFLGIEPRRPATDDAALIAEYTRDLEAARQSWWPGALPSNKVNLGLDLQGGVYLLMEIDPDEVIANQLQVFAADLRSPTIDEGIFYEPPTMNGDSFVITLQDPTRADDFMRVFRQENPLVQGAIGGDRTYAVDRTGASFRITVTDAARSVFSQDAQRKTREIVRRRVDPDGLSEVSVLPQGETRIVLEAPGEANPQRLKDLLSQAGRMTFNLVNSSAEETEVAVSTGRVRAGFSLLYEQGTGLPLLIDNRPLLTGADIATANPGRDEANRPQVEFRLNGRGARAFADATARNVGRRFAIVLDDEVVSAPNINEPIPTGNVRITGSFTLDEATDLAAIIEAGELPARLQFIEERTVGPGLGEDSIRAGTTASIIGLMLVAVFMALTYRLYGLLAVLSLTANVVLILGALSALGATLTLPGIAGIILTIGMAVDANVLVFERIREEQKSGRSPLTAVQAGYERALSTILDANITTFIAASVLYVGAGGGPVGGFAVTLAVGILTSVFTAFVVTRWLTVMYLRAARPRRLAL